MITEVHTWADGFGNWHARVVETGVGDAAEAERRAREAIAAELEARSVPSELMGVKLEQRVSESGHLFTYYAETWPSDEYRTQAARDAMRFSGKRYADYIERHTLEMIERGHLTEEEGLGRSLGEALIGNDGD